MSNETNPTPARRRLTRRSLADLVALSGAAFAVCWRLVPHPFNFAPVGGLGVFAGARLRLWEALALPLAVMIVSDSILFWRDPSYAPSPVVHASMVLYATIGWLLARRGAAWRVGAASLLGSVQFFLITNFGVWLGDAVGVGYGMYQPSAAGLLDCYLQGIPFFPNTLLGDLATSAVLFGAYALLARRVPAEQPAAEKA